MGFFAISPIISGIAGISIIVGAIYMLHLYRKVFYGELKNEKNFKLKDLDKREMIALLPLVVIVIWLGIYPKVLLEPINKGVENMLNIAHLRVVDEKNWEFLNMVSKEDMQNIQEEVVNVGSF